MYQGRLFKWVRKYCHAMGYDYVIISAKYGLVLPTETIEGYEKSIKSNEDIKNLQMLVDSALKSLIKDYEKIVVIAGENYRRVLQHLWDDRFIAIRSRGYTDLCNMLEKAIPKERQLPDFEWHV